ncbi:MAG TPA: MaoC family dehydratase N-terminal domain-containing protein [Egibacteraceae bacterium]
MIVPLEEVAKAVGTDLGGTTFTILPHEHWLTADAILSPRLPEGVAHPMYAYYATQGGMRLTLSELFSLAHAKDDDGVMLGETSLELHRPLRVGATYQVRGEVVDVQRKHGRSGIFDVLVFRLELVDDDGEAVAAAQNSFIFPRRDDGDA